MKKKNKNIDSQFDGDWFYDLIMGSIEPDLTTKNYPNLKKKHRGESKDEEESRARRYKEAFRLFDGVLNDINDNLAKEAGSRKANIRKELEDHERHERTSEVEQAEKKLEDFPFSE